MIERTPRRRKKLPRQRDAEFAGAVARIYEKAVAQVRAGKLDKVPGKTLEAVRVLINGGAIADPKGRPSKLTESAKQHLIDEFMVNGTLEG